MKFHDLAIKNVKENWYQYAAYFFCCTSSVTVFYIFQSLIFHPDIGQDIEADFSMKSFLSATQVLIVIFSFVFVLYSNATFLKSRKKEFGLLMMLGMTRGQLKRLVFYENTAIALLSVGAGIFVGIMFSKLFFMAVSVILKLDQPITFAVVPQAIYWTAIGYLVLFEMISFFTSMTIGRRNLIRFFKIRFGPRLSMFFSVVFTFVSAGLLAWGYYWASTATIYNFGPRTGPVVMIVAIGTYFLFRNASVVIFRLLEKVKPFFYKRTNMLAVSSLQDKMKENAKVLFNVTIASAVILTAAGATYSMIRVVGAQAQDQYPQTIGISSEGLSVKNVIRPERVEKILTQNDVDIKQKIKVRGVPVTVHAGGMDKEIILLSSATYNQAAKKIGRHTVQVKRGNVVYVYPFRNFGLEEIPTGQDVTVKIAGKEISLFPERQINGSLINGQYRGANEMLVLNDRQYQRLTSTLPDHKKMTYVGYNLKNWQSAKDTIEKIHHEIPKKKRDHFTAKTSILETSHSAKLFLFIGVFISLLFFIAAGSLVYFKLFTDLPKDVEQLKALRRLGMTEGEMGRVMSVQVFVIFLVPFLVATIHALFAFNMMRVTMKVEVFQYTWIVIAVFFVIQIIYYWITKNVYMRQLFRR